MDDKKTGYESVPFGGLLVPNSEALQRQIKIEKEDTARKVAAILGALKLTDVLFPPAATRDPKDLSDEDLRRAYLATDGEPGEPVADALAAEIERRHLDI